MQTDDNSTLLEAHSLAEELADHIRAVPTDVVINIHAEPNHVKLHPQEKKQKRLLM